MIAPLERVWNDADMKPSYTGRHRDPEGQRAPLRLPRWIELYALAGLAVICIAFVLLAANRGAR